MSQDGQAKFGDRHSPNPLLTPEIVKRRDKEVRFESVNPFGELATGEDGDQVDEQEQATSESPPVATRGLDTNEEEDDDEMPRLPDRDEHGKKVVKDGPAKLQRKRERERRVQMDIDVEARGSGGDGGEGQDARIQGEGDEEARRARVRSGPGEPTKAERDRHNATHLPYQSWCKFCVKGRGRQRPFLRRLTADRCGTQKKGRKHPPKLSNTRVIFHRKTRTMQIVDMRGCSTGSLFGLGW